MSIIQVETLSWPTNAPGVEQYFQLQKSAGLEGHERIFEEMKTATPDDAFGIGRKGPVCAWFS